MSVQVELEHKGTHVICWLDKPVQPGNKVTLKNSDHPLWWWKVLKVYEHGEPPEHGWKVGGIG